jgi:serine/threonine protein kinase/Tfp pilus assembly protein PilF
MSDEDRLDELLIEWEDQFEQGRDLSATELCSSYPHLAGVLGQEIAKLKKMRFRPEPLPEPPAAEFAGLRFQPVRFLARGGLGEVFVAHDQEVGREVVLKRIQKDKAHQEASRLRFLQEGEITGRLEHPGIVPIYGLGLDASGQPYYAMRFIRGESFRDAIKLYHAATRPGSHSPGRNRAFRQLFLDKRSQDDGAVAGGERNLAFRHLLQRFLAVCNAVAYAHSRGIIHRDLKPANLMLGRYGETLVLDWGLAGLVDRDKKPHDPAEDTLPIAVRDGGRTLPGMPMGTPAFMSPEQANGQWTLVGPGSDIFGLGATLYTLLTGHPPYQGPQALEDAAAGKYRPPRQVNSEAPAALEAVCLKAMALRPSERYATVLEMTRDLENWLADEPLSAYREPLPKRLGRWVRRHKTLVAGIAASLLAALVVGGGAWFTYQQDKADREAEATRLAEARERDVLAALDEAERLLREQKWEEARGAVGRARGRLAGGGPGSLQQRLRQCQADLTIVTQLEQIPLPWPGPGSPFDFAAVDRAYAAVFRSYGIAVPVLEPKTAAARIQKSTIRAQLVVALDRWLFVKPVTDDRGRKQLVAIANGADPNQWRRRFRAQILRQDRLALERLASQEELLAQPASSLLLVIQLFRVGAQPAGLEVLRQAQLHHPGDFWINFFQGVFLLAGFGQPAHPDEAVGYFRAALAVRPERFEVLVLLGIALDKQGKTAEAIGTIRMALRRQPDWAQGHNFLGLALEKQGQAAKAMAAYRLAIKFKPDFADAHFNLGWLLFEQGKWAQAVAANRMAIKFNPDFAGAYTNLGRALYEQGKLAEAVSAYHRAIKIDPNSSLTYNNLGRALERQGKLGEAVAAYRRAIKLKRGYFLAHYNLGRVLHNQGRLTEAVAAYRQAIKLEPDHAQALCFLGLALQREGDFATALKYLKRGHELGSKQRNWSLPSAKYLKEVKKFVYLDGKLPAVLKGEIKPADVAERIMFAWFFQCHKNRYNTTAARFYADGFTAQPELAQDRQSSPRYHAACAAALASAGQGADASQLGNQERTRWRKQALTWLSSDLTSLSQLEKSGKHADLLEIPKTLAQWQDDPDLACLRDASALAKIPEEERAAWEKFWAEVAALKDQAQKQR